jgi:hypothetical protein
VTASANSIQNACMSSVNMVFGSMLGKNGFLNSAVALYKYVHCTSFIYLVM